MTRALHELIRQRFQLGPANHLTHIENLGSIVKAGGLKPFNQLKGASYFDLANPDVQKGRALIVIPTTKRLLHDYVPLYFGFKTPMVAVNQDKNKELIFLRVSLDILAITGVVITDGNARAKYTKFHLYQSIDDLKILDAKAIQSVKYAANPMMKHLKQAEILVPDFLPFANVLDVICFDEDAKKRVLAGLKQFGIQKAVEVNPGWYFRT
ncbi:MAG: DUF4433 domain-containing protein [Deltaproteobacteria bacterium]|nr:DUF4433 domain-containing protein [Deltaproteobacteria bacterium]